MPGVREVWKRILFPGMLLSLVPMKRKWKNVVIFLSKDEKDSEDVICVMYFAFALGVVSETVPKGRVNVQTSPTKPLKMCKWIIIPVSFIKVLW